MNLHRASLWHPARRTEYRLWSAKDFDKDHDRDYDKDYKMIPNTRETSLTKVAGQIWSSDLSPRVLDRLCNEIGPHPAGSEAMHLAVDFVLALMNQAAGDRASAEDVRVPNWTRGMARVEAGPSTSWSGLDKVVQCKSSQSGDVTAPLLEAGWGSPAEIETAPRDAAGKILLVRNGSPPTRGLAMAEKTIAALDAGAVGLIETSTNPAGLAQSNLGRSLGGRNLPSVGVSTAIGSRLRGIAAEGGQVRLVTEGEHGEADCRNAVVDIGQGSEVLLLTAHLDTHDLAPGGFDNTTGICAMLEALFALAPLADQFRRRIRCIAFTAEEAGFVGSQAYVRQHLDDLDEIIFQVNLDSVFPDTAKAMAAHFCRPAIPHLRQLFQAARRPVRVVDFLSNSSDYIPFALQGIPTSRQANLNVGDPPWSHTIVDTADKADVEAIRQNAMVYAQLLLQLALTDEPFPARRLGRDEILEELSRWGAREQWERCEYLDLLREPSGNAQSDTLSRGLKPAPTDAD